MKKALAVMMVLSVVLCGVAVASPTTDLGHIYWSGNNLGSEIKYVELDGTGFGLMSGQVSSGDPRDIVVDEAAGYWISTGDIGTAAATVVGTTDGTTQNNLGDFGDWPYGATGDGTYFYVSGCWSNLDRVDYTDTTGASRVNYANFWPTGCSGVAFGSSAGAGVIYGGGGAIYAQDLAGNLIGSIPAPGGGVSQLTYDAASDTLFILRPGSTYAHISGAAVQASDNSSLFSLAVSWNQMDVARDSTGALKVYYHGVGPAGDIWVADALDGVTGAQFIVNVNLLNGQLNPRGDGVNPLDDVRAFEVTDALVVPEPAGLGLLGIALLGLRKRRS